MAHTAVIMKHNGGVKKLNSFDKFELHEFII
jgi:hypothetical protein